MQLVQRLQGADLNDADHRVQHFNRPQLVYHFPHEPCHVGIVSCAANTGLGLVAARAPRRCWRRSRAGTPDPQLTGNQQAQATRVHGDKRQWTVSMRR